MSPPTAPASPKQGIGSSSHSVDQAFSSRSEESHAGVKRKHAEIPEQQLERIDSPSKKTCHPKRFVSLGQTGLEATPEPICEVAPQSPSEVDKLHDVLAPEVKWEDYFGSWPPMSGGSLYSLGEPRAKGKDPMRDPYTPSSSRESSNKRLLQNAPANYASSGRSGTSSTSGWWGREHAKSMRIAGMDWTFEEDSPNRIDPSRYSLQLKTKLTTRTYSLPEGPDYEPDRLNAILQIAKRHNEMRLVRDITPLLAPPPENLHKSKWFKQKRVAREQNVPFQEPLTGLENICETLDMEWTQVEVICGPRPKPDVVMGIHVRAFTETEKVFLEHYDLPHSPLMFPEDMCLPFFICEAKSQYKTANVDLQAMHAASVASRAIWRFCERVGQTKELEKEFLLFSMTHNNKDVRIWGHFIVPGLDALEPEKLFHRRHLIYETCITTDFEQLNWAKTYHIVRGIYDLFYPMHLQRIKRVLQTMISSPKKGYSIPADAVARADSSAGSSSKRQAQVEDMLREELNSLRAEMKARDESNQRMLANMMEKHEKALEQERENNRRQIADLMKSFAQQQLSSHHSKRSPPSQDSRTSHSSQGDHHSYSQPHAASQSSRRESPPHTSRDPSFSHSQDVNRSREVRPQQSFQSHPPDKRRPSPPGELRAPQSFQSYPMDSRRPSPPREGHPPGQRRPSPPYDNRAAPPPDRAYAPYPPQHPQQSSGTHDSRGQLPHHQARGQMPYPPDQRSQPR